MYDGMFVVLKYVYLCTGICIMVFILNYLLCLIFIFAAYLCFNIYIYHFAYCVSSFYFILSPLYVVNVHPTHTHTHIFQSLSNHQRNQRIYLSRSPASPSWLDEAGPSPTAGHQLTGATHQAPSIHLQKSVTASTINSYVEGSDTRSISNDPSMSNDQQHQHQQHQQQQPNGAITSNLVGGGGKLGYNNNQYVSGAHLGESSEIMLGHIDDTIGHKLQHNNDQHKADQVDYGDQEGGGGGGETETKSLSSVKSGGSNADARYL